MVYSSSYLFLGCNILRGLRQKSEIFARFPHPRNWNCKTLNFSFCQHIPVRLLETLFNFSLCYLNFYFIGNLLNRKMALNNRPTSLGFCPPLYLSFSAHAYCLITQTLLDQILDKLLWSLFLRRLCFLSACLSLT